MRKMALSGSATYSGSEVPHRRVDRLHEFAHRLLHFFLEHGLPRQEPIPVVMARQVAQELDALSRKTRKTGSHDHAPSPGSVVFEIGRDGLLHLARGVHEPAARALLEIDQERSWP